MSMEQPRRPKNPWSEFEEGVESSIESEPSRFGRETDDDDDMPVYMMLSRLTERGRDRIKNHPERILEVNHEVEQRGCIVIAQYALMGQFDFVTIIKAPGNEVMHRLAIELGARGTIETQTYPAIPTEDFINAMKQGGD
ncbi:MAG: GYD domain-containing protein [Chloroflexi bacterium]|nr:GYD domain-containing protein [Chloroflexota bacterium]MDA1296912.1 GYD domain-containing protein [Chloroflexota bacterium]